MKCPFCAELENKVIDSRLSNQGAVIRRRRECLGCERRFTTYERVEEILPMVVKKDGRRENFDRHKVVAGIQLACQKRPVSSEQIEAVVDGIERRLQELGEKEVPSSFIGEAGMRELAARKAGGPHAEVEALREAGEKARGADLYVTLEPCNHQGRTPPCTDAILEAGIARVFVGSIDPNPLVRGRGVRRLRAAGVEVRTGVLREACDA